MAAKHQKNWDGRERWLAETGWARADGCLHLSMLGKPLWDVDCQETIDEYASKVW